MPKIHSLVKRAPPVHTVIRRHRNAAFEKRECGWVFEVRGGVRKERRREEVARCSLTRKVDSHGVSKSSNSIQRDGILYTLVVSALCVRCQRAMRTHIQFENYT